LALAASILLSATAQSAVRTASREPVASHPHVYLMRGLLNIFSLGMDQLATQIAQHGVTATVYNHTLENVVVAEIVQKYRAGDHGPYILVGHSLGADAVMTMAQELNASGVPVALVVPFDGTGASTASANVACVLNVTQRRYAYMQPGAGFRGKLQNLDVSSDPSIDHLTIDKSPRLQAIALQAVLSAARAETCRPDTNGPLMARSRAVPTVKIGMPRLSAPHVAAAPTAAPKIASPAPAEAPKQSSNLPAKNPPPSLRAGFEG
jgi:pimeloyl-ACP methyl ester carboxylesterase